MDYQYTLKDNLIRFPDNFPPPAQKVFLSKTLIISAREYTGYQNTPGSLLIVIILLTIHLLRLDFVKVYILMRNLFNETRSNVTLFKSSIETTLARGIKQRKTSKENTNQLTQTLLLPYITPEK